MHDNKRYGRFRSSSARLNPSDIERYEDEKKLYAKKSRVLSDRLRESPDGDAPDVGLSLSSLSSVNDRLRTLNQRLRDADEHEEALEQAEAVEKKIHSAKKAKKSHD